MYAVFKLTDLGEKFPAEYRELLPHLGVAIWTTTPWTIPGNAAVAVNHNLEYAIVHVRSKPVPEPKPGQRKPNFGSALLNPKINFVIVAKDLVSKLEEKWNADLTVKGTMMGSALEHCRYTHPLEDRSCPVVIGGDYITTATGTGLVHTAPGHGQEDFITGKKYGLPLISPVDDNGKFTKEAGQFEGLEVLYGGNTAVLKAMDECGSMLMEERYVHKYPYDWRSHKPTIFRATDQWFASVEGFMQPVLEAIKKVPPQGETKIRTMVSGRKEWCISRQRSWGVPIPVFYDMETGEPLLTQETIAHVQKIVLEKGADAWWTSTVEELLPEEYKAVAHKYKTGTDTMDVWFDSGTSWAAVLGGKPADLYLEGSDQHRGWFQSSLLTSVATTGVAPFRQVLTHGFVLDDKGRKMSKSAGNVVDPRTVIETLGADVLRLWVSSVDYSRDVSVGPEILNQSRQKFLDLRNTLKYLLSNLYDWKPEMTVAYKDLPSIDKYQLSQLAGLVSGINESMQNYQFVRFNQLLQHFSAFVDVYIDISKGRLYTSGSDSHTRRACQTVLASVLLCMVRAISPIVPHLAEDAWEKLPFPYLLPDGSKALSVFEAMWPEIDPQWLTLPPQESRFWSVSMDMRKEVRRVLELAKSEELICENLQAKVYFHVQDEDKRLLLSHFQCMSDADKLHNVFGTAEAVLLSPEAQAVELGLVYTVDVGNLWIGVSRADGDECLRCKNYSTTVGTMSDPGLCEFCQDIQNLKPQP